MKVIAPGKLLLAGAYAVLDGWPALVVAVDRHAVADGDVIEPHPNAEVVAAMSATEAPHVDGSRLRDRGQKLGLGSSAAMLVASLGVVAARRGDRLDDPEVRDRIFREARRAHADVQSGGSGVDIAASVHGGVLEYVLEGDDDVRIRRTTLPGEVVVEVLWTGTPSTTTGMRARVDAFRARDGRGYAGRIDAVGEASRAAIAAVRQDDARAFIDAIGNGAAALAALGVAADAPIFPPGMHALCPVAEADGAAFIPSGAGGGDVFVHVGQAPASAAFLDAAASAGMQRVAMNLDPLGVRLV